MNVIIRKGNIGENDLVAFDLDIKCNLGFIWCIDKDGSSEACLDYYHNSKKADESEVREMVTMLENAYNEKVNVKQRLSSKATKYIWSR